MDTEVLEVRLGRRLVDVAINGKAFIRSRVEDLKEEQKAAAYPIDFVGDYKRNEEIYNLIFKLASEAVEDQKDTARLANYWYETIV